MNPAPQSALQHPFLAYSYFGLYTVLRHHRLMTFVGWGIVVLSAVALLVFRRSFADGGLVPIGTAVLAIVAGVAIVQVSVAAVSAYTHIPYPDPPQGEDTAIPEEAVRELQETLRAVDNGGWQEALFGLDRLKVIGERYGLPAPG